MKKQGDQVRQPRRRPVRPRLPGLPTDPFYPALVNRYGPRESFIWLRMISFASEIEEVDVYHADGTPSECLQHEIENLGWRYLLDVPWSTGEGYDGAAFLAMNGLAPCQPFLACISEPCYSTDYYGEHDVDIGAAPVATVPWAPTRVYTSWVRESRRCGFDLTFGDHALKRSGR